MALSLFWGEREVVENQPDTFSLRMWWELKVVKRASALELPKGS